MVVVMHLHSTRDIVPGIIVHEHEAVAAIKITGVWVLRVGRSYLFPTQNRVVNWAQGLPAFLGGFVFVLGLFHEVKIWAGGQGSNRVRLEPTQSQFVPEWD